MRQAKLERSVRSYLGTGEPMEEATQASREQARRPGRLAPSAPPCRASALPFMFELEHVFLILQVGVRLLPLGLLGAGRPGTLREDTNQARAPITDNVQGTNTIDHLAGTPIQTRRNCFGGSSTDRELGEIEAPGSCSTPCVTLPVPSQRNGSKG